MNANANGKRGFTLLELMVAVGILVIVIAGVFSSIVYAVLLNETSSNLAIAANDAQSVLEQMKAGGFANLSAYTPPVYTNLPSESITVSRSIGNKIAEVNANVTWVERNRNRSFSLSTRIAR